MVPSCDQRIGGKSELQRAKLAADPTYGGYYSSLNDLGQATLAMVPYVALLIFGFCDDSSEYVQATMRAGIEWFSNLDQQAVQVGIRDAASLVFLRLHNYYTHGHCWLADQAGMRRGAWLYFQRWVGDPDSIESENKVTQGDRDHGGLLRRCLHPVCVRSGMDFIADYVKGIQTDTLKVRSGMDFIADYIKGIQTDTLKEASHNCRASNWTWAVSGLIDWGFWRPDAYTSRRLRVAPEGGQQITLFAAFAKDLMTSPLGGLVSSQSEMIEAMQKLAMSMKALINNPFAVHPSASFLGVDPTPIDTSAFEATWPLANSYYIITKSHTSMLGAQRISPAGSSPLHSTMKKTFEEAVVEVNSDAWISHL